MDRMKVHLLTKINNYPHGKYWQGMCGKRRMKFMVDDHVWKFIIRKHKCVKCMKWEKK